MSSKSKQVLKRLAAMKSEENIAGMARFGINVERAFGVSVTTLRGMGKEIGKDHELAQELWDSGYHEARMLATIIDDPKMVTKAQAEAWVKDVASWDLCDGLAGNLLDKTPFAYEKALEWSQREAEFVRRAGFALMAWLPVHDKKAPNEKFAAFFPAIARYSSDERNYVKKAVSWALRNIGKRNSILGKQAIKTAGQIANIDSKTARWVAQDALKELTSEKVQRRLKEKR